MSIEADYGKREKAFDCGNYDNYQINFKLWKLGKTNLHNGNNK